jgi:HSP20 family molecular chaperone IbpA
MLYNFDDMFSSLAGIFEDTRFSYAEIFPPTNIFLGSDGSWEISLALAGYAKEELTVRLESDIVIVEANPEETKEVKSGRYHRCKIKKSSFKKMYALPRGIAYDIDSIKVTFENGLLTINVPVLTDNSKNRSIEIL